MLIHLFKERAMRSFIITPLLAISLLATSGCSWFGSSSGEGDENGLSESDLAAQREGRFGAGTIPTAEGEGLFRDIRFGYDSYSVEDEGRSDLEANARTINAQSGMAITLEGHCDERGTVEYNMALGAARAKAVKNALVTLGVPSNRVETISYGEEIPLDAAHDEAAYAKNRRVHFSSGASAAATETKNSRY